LSFILQLPGAVEYYFFGISDPTITFKQTIEIPIWVKYHRWGAAAVLSRAGGYSDHFTKGMVI